MIQRQGVLVLNDAYAMSHAFIDKLYFEELPQEIKPRSIITRKKEDILAFYEEMGHKMVLKPLEGSGGQGVFLVDENEPNLNQIIDTLRADGYIIAQEFLPAAGEGDIRVVLMNGRLLSEDGKNAIIRRKGAEGEFRNNMSAGGSSSLSELTPEIEHIINITAPKLIRGGLFFVGLDVVEDKLIEINVLSPGGLEAFEAHGFPNFSTTVIEAIERKVSHKEMHPTTPNKILATME
jgi:glutathione synthase